MLSQDDKNMIKRMRGNNISLDEYQEIIIDNIPKDGEIVGKLYEYNNKYPKVSNQHICTIQLK